MRVAQAIFAGMVAVTLAAAGCGSKTGLETPDGGPDAGPDAMLPDAFVPPPPCILVPPETRTVTAMLTLPAELQIVDVFFLLDASASMDDEIGEVRDRLVSTVVPGVSASIPDAAFGLAFTGEFPEEPHGPPDVRPYVLMMPITRDVTRIEAALERPPSYGNFDDPESQVEGLYQLMTGEGLAPWITPALGCPTGGTGGACFRPEALPLVVLITDAPMHNGPPGVDPEAPYEFLPSPHGYLETLDLLRERRVLVIGLGATDVGTENPMAHLRAVARDTGAVEGDGSPLAFDIGSDGRGVGSTVVRAIERVAEGVLLDVDAVASDLPGDDGDALELITGIRPLSADPPDGVRGIEGVSFVGVQPGTRLTFAIDVDASALPPADVTRRYRARIIFRASGRSRVGSQDVWIVVPGADGGGCEVLESEG